jgi:hypothetical protein
MGAWEKLALGWLGDDLARVALGANATIELGPAEGATRNRFQALRVDLPNFTKTTVVFPVDGSDPNYFYSGQGYSIDTSLSRSFAAATATPISFRAAWDIETDWTDAFVVRPGFAVDSIAVAGTVDNATSTAGWTLNGLQQISGGQYTQTYFHDYLAESRSYVRKLHVYR